MANERNPDVSRATSPRFVAPAPGPERAIAQGIENLANIGAQVRTNQLTDDLQARLMEEQRDFLGSQELNPADPLMNLTGPDKNVVDTFVDIQSKLAIAAEQRTAPLTQLKIKQETILREYMSKYPRLSPNFQQAAAGVLGYNPIGSAVEAAAQQRQMHQSQVQAIYERVMAAADKAGVNPALQLTNPREYWSRAVQFLSDAEEVAASDRNLKILENQRAVTGKQKLPMLRQSLPARMAMHLSTDIIPALQEFHGMTPAQKEQLAGTEYFDQIRAGLIAQRSALVSEYMAEYAFTDVTPERMEQELQPLLALYDYAAENVSDDKAILKLEGLVRASTANLTMALPREARQLNMLADLLGTETISASSVGRQVSSLVAESLYGWLVQSSGGKSRVAPFVQPSSTSEGTFNPAAGESRYALPSEMGVPPEEAYLGYKQAADTHVTKLISTYKSSSDESVRREAGNTIVNALVSWGNAYGPLIQENEGALPPQAVVDSWLRLFSDPVIAEVVNEDPARRTALVGAARSMLNKEFQQVRSIIEETFTAGNFKPTNSFGQSPDRVLSAGEYLDFDFSGGDMVFTMLDSTPEEARPRMQAWIEELNRTPMRTEAGRIIKGIAHIDGHTDYKAAARTIQRAMLRGEGL